ncbi:MAG: CHAT domain-containing protein [Agriterribacter sp.]
MKRKFCLFTFFCLMSVGILLAQCPNRDSLWNRLVFLTNASGKVPGSPDQLKELLRYESHINGCSYRNDSTHAFLLQRIAVLYFQQGNYVNAVKEIKKSIAIINYNRNSTSINLKHLTRSYYILYRFYKELKKDAEKMAAIDSCVFLSIRLNAIDINTLDALGEQVKYVFDVGNYKKAYELCILGESLSEQSGCKNSNEFINFFSGWKVNSLIALKEYRVAEKIVQDQIRTYSLKNASQDLGTVYEQLAQLQVETFDIEKAKINFQKAYQYDLKNNQIFGCAQTLNNLAYYIYFRHARDFEKSITFYKKALQCINTIKIPGAIETFESLNIYGNIAAAYVQERKYDDAFKNFQIAFDKIKPGITEKEIIQSGWIDSSYSRTRYLVGLMIKKSEAYIKRFKETHVLEDAYEAMRICKLTDHFLDKIKSRQSEIQSKLFWRTDTRNVYEHAIEACYLAGKPAEAFYFFEKSRAVLLNEQLNEQQLLKEEDILSMAQLKTRILTLERDYNSAEPGSAVHTEIEKKLFITKQELDRLTYNIKIHNPLYYQSFLDTSSVSLHSMQKHLSEKRQSLLEIFSGDSAIYVLMVTADKSYLKKINKDDFEKTTNTYTSYLSDAELMNRRFAEFVNVSAHLYKLIFGNLPPASERIIISPDGKYFPFEALLTSNNSRPFAYFLNDHAVSYTYSCRFLTNDFSSTSKAGNNFLGIAPVNYPSSFALSALHGSAESLSNIGANIDKANIETGVYASRNNFLRRFYQYRIVQIYTHASDSSMRNEPVIYFADSALYLSEIMNEYKPVTRLVVLSACRTATGKSYQGEGVFSFNRSFAGLGIPAAIANLWSVDNTSTYTLTELFYKWLAKGFPTDIALQKAKLEFLQSASKEKSMPYFWARY